MRIPSFEVRNQRSIGFVRCETANRLMIIAGPNGAGKSTLLNAIRAHAGYNNVIYVGPHRAMRKQTVQQRYLFQQSLSLETILAGSNVPGMEGIRIFDGSRDPWGYDETSNYLKYALCQIEVDRSRAITARVDRDGGIERGAVVDAWKPFKELASNLLPHLAFEKIDASNRDQVKVLFRVHRLDTLVDLDDLSSGEKSIIQMFYPVVERNVKALVAEIETGQRATERPEVCILIDEPELHLHPNLQVKVLDYMRVLTSGQNVQVIVATHSPTIVENATFDELFLIRPIELVNAGDNQLVRVADDEDKLAALRSLFGSTNNLTAMLPVIVVEGASAEGGRAVPDRSIYRALHPGFDRATLISGGGKNECVALARTLAEALTEFSTALRVVALLDRDTQVGEHDSVSLLPVSMIENFLVDPDVIFEAIESVRERSGLRTIEDVSAALDDVVNAQEPAEIGRRVGALLPAMHFHPGSDVATVGVRAIAFSDSVREKYSDERIQEAHRSAQAKIGELRDRHRRREEFDGKRLLKAFFRQHLTTSTLSAQVFAFYAARRARRRRAVTEFFDGFFERQNLMARARPPAS